MAGTQADQLRDKTYDMSTGILTAGNGNEENVESRMVAQKLVYDFPRMFAVTKMRQYLSQQAQNEKYTVKTAGGSIVVYMASAEWAVNPRNTYLTFTVKGLAPEYTYVAGDQQNGYAGVFTGPGGIYNMFASVRALSASGQELGSTRNIVYCTKPMDEYSHPPEWFDSAEAGMEGYCNTSPLYALATPTTPAEYTKRMVNQQGICISGNDPTRQGVQFSVPLSKLVRAFDVSQLLPPYLVSGMRIELQLQSPDKAFIHCDGKNGGAYLAASLAAGYEVSDVRVVADTYSLDAPVLGSIQKLATEAGLEILFNDVDIIQNQLSSATTTASINVRKAVGRCNLAYTTIQSMEQVTGGTVSAQLPGASAAPWNVSFYQWKNSGMYMPPSGVRTTLGINGVVAEGDTEVFSSGYQSTEAIWHALRCFGSNRTLPYGCAVNASNWGPVPVIGKIIDPISVQPNALIRSPNYGTSMCAVNLQRSDELEHSGLPLSMARQLSLDIQFFKAYGTGAMLTTVIFYSKALKIWLDRINIRE